MTLIIFELIIFFMNAIYTELLIPVPQENVNPAPL